AEKGAKVRILLLAVFGVAGTLARYGLEGAVQHRSGSSFPYGTLSVNLVGCFLLGLVGKFALNHVAISPDWRIGLTVGLFGAFTTFSTFSWETVRMLEDGEWVKGSAYVAASVLLGLIVMLAGIRLGDAI
ncbi:MAG TPA: fluoride efflux transporter CrcB, partial [Candidatus Acidoferrales bacterium]|nr:fluoride efflux transporter CrcB [Candidatus Acidoferrales bacterium]